MAEQQDVFQSGLEKICRSFSIAQVKDYQRKFFQEYFEDRTKDFFIAQPTDSGKSLIFQALSTFVNLIDNVKTSTVIVVSPLIALMTDQCDILSSKEIPACCLSIEMVSDNFLLSLL